MDSGEVLQFGIIPSTVVTDLGTVGNWKARADAIERMENLIGQQRDGSQILPTLSGLLEFLSTLQQDANFKISLAATTMLGATIGLVGFDIKPHMGFVCQGLVSKLTDGKSIVRQANMKVIVKLMQTLRPRIVLDVFLSALSTAPHGSRTKAEIISTIIMALLTFGKDDFAFPPIVRALLPCITSETGRVREAAMEAMAVVNHSLDSHLGGLLSSCGADEPTRHLLNQRFQSPALATISAEGLIELPAPLGSISKKSSFISTDSGDRAEYTPGLSRCNSNGKIPWDVPLPRARSSGGRRTRGAVGYGSEAGEGREEDSKDSIMVRRLQKQPPQVEVSPGGAPPINRNGSSSNYSSGFLTPSGRDGMTEYRDEPLSAGRQGSQTGPACYLSRSVASGGPLTPKRTPGSLQYADRMERISSSSGDGSNPLDECRSPSSLKVRTGDSGDPGFLAHQSTPVAGRRRPSVAEDTETHSGTSSPLPSHGRRAVEHAASAARAGGYHHQQHLQYEDAGSPSPVSSPTLARHPSAGDPRFNHSWNGIDTAPVDDSYKSSTWTPATPVTPGGSVVISKSSQLAHLKRRNHESRRGTSTSTPSGIDSVTPTSSGKALTRPPPVMPPEVGGNPFPDRADSASDSLWNNSPTGTSENGRASMFRDSSHAPSALSSPGFAKKRPVRTAAASAGPSYPPSPGAEEDGEMTSASRARSGTAFAAVDMGRSAVQEFETSQLQPMANPSQEISKVLKTLVTANNANRKQLDWVAQHSALTNARRLVVHHKEVVCSRLHEFVLAVLPAADALRSLTVKNTLLLLQEAFQTLGRVLDPEVDQICPVLVKKAGEVSKADGRETFLASEAGKTLVEMTRHCSDTRSVVALVACSSHNSKDVRAKVAAALDSLLRNNDPGPTTTERCFHAAVKFLEDAGVDTRTYGKRILWAIYRRSPSEWETLLRKVSDKAKLSKVREVVAKGVEPPTPIRTANGMAPRRGPSPGSPLTAGGARSTPGSRTNSYPQSPDYGSGLSRANSGGIPHGHPPPAPTNPRSRGRSPSRFKGKSAGPDSREDARGAVNHELEDTVNSALSDLDSKDWKDRTNGLKKLTQAKSQLRLLPEGRVNALLEALAARLSDGNSKVNVLALETLETVFPCLGNQAAIALNIMVPALAANVASTNEKIRSKAVDTVDSLISSVDGSLVVQNLSHVVSHGNQRSKAVMLERLEHLVKACYSRQPRLVGKHALTAALSCLNDSKVDVRNANAQLLRALYHAMGPQMLEAGGALSSDVRQKLEAIVR